jgi:hypothetical protein
VHRSIHQLLSHPMQSHPMKIHIRQLQSANSEPEWRHWGAHPPAHLVMKQVFRTHIGKAVLTNCFS